MTLTTLIDRAQIEDLLVDYYGHLGTGGGNFGDFYVADGILDVNGLIAKGQQAIKELYEQVRRGTPRRAGTFRMLLTNPRIIVTGDAATADVLWTGVNSASVNSLPQIVEQGREHDELVKRDGHSRHTVSSAPRGLARCPSSQPIGANPARTRRPGSRAYGNWRQPRTR